jgi:hypothetical protein
VARPNQVDIDRSNVGSLTAVPMALTRAPDRVAQKANEDIQSELKPEASESIQKPVTQVRSFSNLASTFLSLNSRFMDIT